MRRRRPEKRIILPEGDTQGLLELIGIPTYEEYYYGMHNDGDIVIKDLSLYGNFAFRTRSNFGLYSWSYGPVYNCDL